MCLGAVCPSPGKAAALIMPICNTAAMNHHLCEISGQVAADAHAVVILDGASWHNSHGLVVPGNITLLALPPYSPELNPVERIWHYLRSHWLANSVFRTLADIMDACEVVWNRFATNTGLVRSLCAVGKPKRRLPAVLLRSAACLGYILPQHAPVRVRRRARPPRGQGRMPLRRRADHPTRDC
jgi:transposase